jgi:hypothetical protein
MTRTAIRHTLSALAAVALVAAFPGGAVAGETGHFLGLDHTLTNKQTGVNVNPEALATQKGPQATHNWQEIESLQINTPRGRATHYPTRWWQDYGGGR